ncbi:MAG: aromatic ring-hydroxylating dioxygenase subunit alpha, partial [Gammaproteobacteria bacterium]|nr:aromatic ring-hydroxylating dioxygenase subunit alpha [Gammaproteobacteria bacterium]
EECYHCPRVHPELCKVVPLYGEGVTSHAEVPGWQPADPSDRGDPDVADGMTTWTIDGRTTLPVIEGLDPAKRDKGMWFATLLPGIFVVAHPQYARSMRVRPIGPERLELIVSWLLPRDVAATHADELGHMMSLANLVIAQDARACELNQQGLRNRPHRQGVLVPQEGYVAAFHDWLRGRLPVGRQAT